MITPLIQSVRRWYHRVMPKGYITVKQAAAILGVSKRRVLQLIAKKRLPAEPLGNMFIVKEDDLELVKDRPAGNPKFRKDST